MSFVVDSKGGCFLCLQECGSRSGGGLGLSSTTTTPASSILSLKWLTRLLGLRIRAVLKKTSIDPIYLSQSVVRNGDIGVPVCGGCSEITRALSELVQQLELVRLRVAASVAKIEGVMVGSERDCQVVREYNNRRGMMVSNSASPHQDIIVSTLWEKLRKEVVLKCSQFSRGTFPRVELSRLEGSSSSSTNSRDHHHRPSAGQTQPPPLQGRRSMLISTAASDDKNNGVGDHLVARLKDIQAEMISSAAPGEEFTLPVKEESKEEEVEEKTSVEKVIPPGETNSSDPTGIPPLESRGGGKGSFICTFCPQVFDTADGIRAHIYVAHKTQTLLAHKEPHTSVELFEGLVDELFAEISLPQELDGSYGCAFCDEIRQGSLGHVYSHLIPSHMEELGRRLKKLQEITTATAAAAAASHNITFCHLPSGGYECSLCSKVIWKGRGKRDHILSHTGERPFACQTCPDKAYRRRETLEDHKLREHRSAYFRAFKDPRLSPEQFEQAVRSLFVGLIRKEIHGEFKCGLCASGLGLEKTMGGVVAHIIQLHMDQLGPKLKELQEGLASSSGGVNSGGKKKLAAVRQSGGGGGGSFKCDLCTRSCARLINLQNHKYLKHRSTLFSQHKDPRLSSAQFERVLWKLFEDLVPSPQAVDGTWVCPFCDTLRHKYKVRIDAHVAVEHVELLLPNLNELQKDMVERGSLQLMPGMRPETKTECSTDPLELEPSFAPPHPEGLPLLEVKRSLAKRQHHPSDLKRPRTTEQAIIMDEAMELGAARGTGVECQDEPDGEFPSFCKSHQHQLDVEAVNPEEDSIELASTSTLLDDINSVLGI